ncbi:MAG: phosphatidate cytidylyltransferase [Candidatus Nanopelagicales bacterium]
MTTPGHEPGQPSSADPAAGGAAPAKSKAGRNLPAAVAVGLVLAAITVLSLYTQIWIFLVVIALAIVIGTDELNKAVGGHGIRLSRFPLLTAAGALPVIGYFLGPAYLLMAFGLWFLFLLVWRLFRLGVGDFVRDATASSFVLAYAPLMGGFAALIAASPDGADRVVTFIVLSVASDIGGYAAGVLLGKHPMAPAISPKKSWEGFAGSVTLQVLVGVACFVWLLDASWWKGALAGAIMTVTATLGDFIESAMKRDLGIKDMSQLLPGHGGLMDRLDSIIPNTVVAYTLFALLLGGVAL